MDRKNLIKAMEYLEKNVPEEMFDMYAYRAAYGPGWKEEYNNPECRTVGCAVGHLTAIDPEGFIQRSFDYYQWSKDYFELSMHDWAFLFSDQWATTNNTVMGVLNRISFLIVNGPSQGLIEQYIGCSSARAESFHYRHADGVTSGYFEKFGRELINELNPK